MNIQRRVAPIKVRLLMTVYLVLIASSLTIAAPEQTSSVLSGAGGQAAGGSFKLVSATGQPGGIEVSSGGNLVNYAGFLGTFNLQPNLDIDDDGLDLPHTINSFSHVLKAHPSGACTGGLEFSFARRLTQPFILMTWLFSVSRSTSAAVR